jgi:hypothetical protein
VSALPQHTSGGEVTLDLASIVADITSRLDLKAKRAVDTLWTYSAPRTPAST